MKRSKSAAALVLMAASALPAAAQLPNASTPALGMGNNFTAAARGYNAVAWNPAMLGVPGSPSYSLALAQVGVQAGLEPVTLGDISAFEGEVIDMITRRRWLQRIEADGGESGTGGADVTWLAAQVGRFGVQLSTTGRALAELSPGAAELFLFGNAGFENGEPRPIAVDDSELHGNAVTTAGLSYAQPFNTSGGTLSVGATVKYTVGHVVVVGENRGSTITAEPVIDLRFPVISTESGGNNGAGFGLDVGVAFARNNITIAAAVQNVFNTFEWSAGQLVYRPGTALLDATNRATDFDEHAYSEAPLEMRTRVSEMKYRPALRAGVAYTATNRLLLTADVHSRFGESELASEPNFHAGAGAEYRLFPFLLVRAGGAAVTDGFQYAGGLGIEAGPVALHGSIAQRDGVTVTMVTLLSARR